jgi:hypothetical protein
MRVSGNTRPSGASILQSRDFCRSRPDATQMAPLTRSFDAAYQISKRENVIFSKNPPKTRRFRYFLPSMTLLFFPQARPPEKPVYFVET